MVASRRLLILLMSIALVGVIAATVAAQGKPTDSSRVAAPAIDVVVGLTFVPVPMVPVVAQVTDDGIVGTWREGLATCPPDTMADEVDHKRADPSGAESDCYVPFESSETDPRHALGPTDQDDE